MKIIKSKSLVYLFSICIFFVISCKKDISLSPITFQPTTYTTENQINAQLAGIYNVLELDQMYGQGMWGYINAGADESFRNGTNALTTFLPELYNIPNTDRNVQTLWSGLYAGIERANVLLNNIEAINMDSANKAHIKGQTLFLRGFYYYILVTNFGDVPLKPKISSAMADNFQLYRSPAKDVFRQVVTDLIKADSLSDDMSNVNNASIVTKSAVEGMLARVFLYMSGKGYPSPNNPAPENKYDSALLYASKVINSNNHSLFTSYLPLNNNNVTPSYIAYSRLFIDNMQNNANDGNYAYGGEGIFDAAFLSKSNTSGSYSGSGYTANQQLGCLMGVICPSGDVQSSNYGVAAGTYRSFPKLYDMYGSGDTRRDWNFSNYRYSIVQDSLLRTPTGAKLGIFDKDSILTVNIIGGGGSGATATAKVDATGRITSVRVDNPGFGYTSNPTITVSTPRTRVVNRITKLGTGAGAVFTPQLSASGTINKIVVSYPTASFTPYPTVYDRTVAKWRREYEVNVPPTRPTDRTSSNFPIIRYADVLLMAAEAAFNLGNIADAKSYYNQVRRRAYNNTNQGDAGANFSLQDIKDERYRELCFEGLRRSDLIRWGDMEKEMSALISSNNIFSTSVYATYNSVAANNFLSNPTKYKLLPIPYTEILADNNLTQNPGW